jgi:long-chain acyl-CoA synthetase
MLSLIAWYIRTVYDVIQRGARLFPNQRAIGFRDTLRIHEEETEVKRTVKGKETTEKKQVRVYLFKSATYLGCSYE